MGQIVIYLFVNGTETIKFKPKVSETVVTPLSLGNMSKDLSVDNLENNVFYGSVYDFSVDYDIIAVYNILDIHKYLMEKNSIVQKKMFRFMKQIFFTAMMFFGWNPLKCFNE